MLQTAVVAGRGVFSNGGGWELVGVIAAAAIALVGAGAGRISVDHLLRGGRTRQPETTEREPEHATTR
ncbi:hypothetical protein HJ590_13650 [Naumannella sp. ID2617S]|nr:hypothetical protein [Naumannella sp. ID2617S]